MPAAPAIITELLSLHRGVYPPKPDRWEPHLHGFHQLDVVLDGEMIVDVEGEEDFEGHRLGQSLLTPPLVRHGYRTSKGFRVAMFKFHVAPRYWTAFGSRSTRLDMPRHLLQSIQRAGESWEKQAPFRRLEALSVANLCMLEILSQRPAEPAIAGDPLDAFRGKLWPLLEQVESRPYEEWTVVELAGECHLSADHFSKCFRETLEQSPQQYLVRCRMRAAAQELAADTDLTIKEMASRAGYATVHAFTRAFSRVMGVSPAAYRRAPAHL